MSAAHIHMSTADAAWLRMDGPANPMVINALVRFEDPLDPQRLRQVLQQRLLIPYPKFTMLVDPGRVPLVGSLPRLPLLPEMGAAWVPDPRFDLGRHLHRVALPSPGGQQALLELVGDIVSAPLPADRPPWQAHVIECGDGETSLLMRMHHCIADGIALARVLLSLTDGIDETARSAQDSDERAASTTAPSGGLAHEASTIVHEGAETVLHPSRLLRLAEGGARDVQTFAQLLLRPADSEKASRGRLSGVRRVGISPAIDLDFVKAIAHRHGATVNDVLLAAVAGAVRGHVSAGDGGTRVTAIVPFNLRPLEEPLGPELGNRFGLVFLDLPVQERDRRGRLALVKDRMDEIKRSPEGPVTYAVLQAIGVMPADVERRLVQLFSAKGTMVVTNVPGPAAPRLLAGAMVSDFAIWAPASGSVGMSVSLFSYRGRVSVGLLADTAVLAQPQAVAEQVAMEMRALGRLRRYASRQGRAA